MKRFIAVATASLAVLAFAQDNDRQTGHPQNQPTDSKQPQVAPADQTKNRSQNERGRVETKTASEIQQVVDQATVQLPDAMRAAEKSAPSGARMTGASYCTWEHAQGGLTRSNDKNNPAGTSGTSGTPGTTDNSAQDSKSISPTHPVVKVCFVGNNRITEVIVCGKSGQVMGTKELTNVQIVRSD